MSLLKKVALAALNPDEFRRQEAAGIDEPKEETLAEFVWWCVKFAAWGGGIAYLLSLAIS